MQWTEFTKDDDTRVEMDCPSCGHHYDVPGEAVEPDAEDAFFFVSADTMARAQFYDCKLCRAIVLDRAGHTEFHNDEDVS